MRPDKGYSPDGTHRSHETSYPTELVDDRTVVRYIGQSLREDAPTGLAIFRVTRQARLADGIIRVDTLGDNSYDRSWALRDSLFPAVVLGDTPLPPYGSGGGGGYQNPFAPPVNSDTIVGDRPSSVREVYEFRNGGASGTLLARTTVDYAAADKEFASLVFRENF